MQPMMGGEGRDESYGDWVQELRESLHARRDDAAQATGSRLATHACRPARGRREPHRRSRPIAVPDLRLPHVAPLTARSFTVVATAWSRRAEQHLCLLALDPLDHPKRDRRAGDVPHEAELADGRA